MQCQDKNNDVQLYSCLAVIRFMTAISILLTMMYRILIVRWLLPMSMTALQTFHAHSYFKRSAKTFSIVIVVVVITFSFRMFSSKFNSLTRRSSLSTDYE